MGRTYGNAQHPVPPMPNTFPRILEHHQINTNTNTNTKNNKSETSPSIRCSCCQRVASEKIRFYKGYKINEHAIESYRKAFPEYSSRITLGDVCLSCYNKQYRYSRGTYIPKPLRHKNKGITKQNKTKQLSSITPTQPAANNTLATTSKKI